MKKLFAVILALSMIAAMLPAGTVLAADTETEKYEFIFAKEAWGISGDSGQQSINAYGIGNIKAGDAWKVHSRLGGSANINVTVHKKASFMQFATTSNSNSSSTNDVHDNAVVFEMRLGITDVSTRITQPATDGVYIPTVTNTQHGEQTYFGQVDLYLISVSNLNKRKWSVANIDSVKEILKSAPKLGDASWTPTSDVLHFYSSNDAVDAADAVLIADRLDLTGGTYYLIATISKPVEWVISDSTSSAEDNKVFGAFSKITFTREADNKELTSAFTAEEVEHSKADINVYGYKSTNTANAIVKHEAVTTDTVTVSTTDTENFIYWAQGLTDEKKILSFEPSFEYTPAEGNNYLVAVYRDTSDKAEFFNANGQREAVLLTNGTAPALPERVGYKPATAWVDLDGKEVAPGDMVTVSGYNAYVPNYGERISVTVNGTSYNYGDMVKLDCNDVDYYKEGKYFKGWKKDNVIVSTSETYSFLAYKDTTVTDEWANEPFNFSGDTRKIILDAFNGALMAEFIGFGDNVVEKGIMFTDTTKTKNIAMTTDSSQFVIIPDKAGTYKGYAIVEDSDGTQTLVTDGEYEKAEKAAE